MRSPARTRRLPGVTAFDRNTADFGAIDDIAGADGILDDPLAAKPLGVDTPLMSQAQTRSGVAGQAELHKERRRHAVCSTVSQQPWCNNAANNLHAYGGVAGSAITPPVTGVTPGHHMIDTTSLPLRTVAQSRAGLSFLRASAAPGRRRSTRARDRCDGQSHHSRGIQGCG